MTKGISQFFFPSLPCLQRYTGLHWVLESIKRRLCFIPSISMKISVLSSEIDLTIFMGLVTLFIIITCSFHFRNKCKNPSRVFLVGYIFNPKKQSKVFTALENAANRLGNVTLIPLEPALNVLDENLYLNVHSLPKLDAIIHKITDLMVLYRKWEWILEMEETKNTNTNIQLPQHFQQLFAEERTKVQAFQTALQWYQGIPKRLPFHSIPILDNVNAVWLCVDRKAIYNILEEACAQTPEQMFSSLRWAEVCSHWSRETMQHTIEEYDFTSGPVLIKHREACGTQASHTITYVPEHSRLIDHILQIFQQDSNSNFRQYQGLILQKFFDHQGIVFKIYVLYDDIQVVRMASMFPPDYLKRDRIVETFHSDEMKAQLQNPMPDIEEPNITSLKALVKSIRKKLDLKLFGMDVLFDVTTRKYVLVDLNYFPTFQGVPDAFYYILKNLIEEVQS